jgi:hypothetical protein
MPTQKTNALKPGLFFLALIYCLFLNYPSTAQVAGDYRSIATGNWSSATTWEYYNGVTWIAATKYPGQVSGDKGVTIQNPHIVTWDLPALPFQFESIYINVGATLQDRVGAYNYYFFPHQLISVSGTLNMANSSDVTSYIAAGNIDIDPTGSLSAHKITIGLTYNAGIATISDVMGAGVLWYNQFGAVLNFGGASMGAALNASTFGDNMVNYNSSAYAQSIASPADGAYFSLTLSGTGGKTKTLSGTTRVLGSLSIQNNSVFSLGGFDLSVAGDWNNSSTNAGCFVPGTKTVTLNGSDQQNIINSGQQFGSRFYNLNLANTSPSIPQFVINFSPSSNVLQVTNSLTMTSGVVNLNSYALQLGVVYTSQASLVHTGTSSAGWFYGGDFLRFLQTNTFIPDGSVANGLFPTGTPTDFRPFYVSCPFFPPTTSTYVSAQSNASTNTTIVNIPDTGGPIVRQYQGYWNIKTSAMNGVYTISAGGTGFGTVGNVGDLRLSLSSITAGSAGTNSGTPSFPIAQRTGITNANFAHLWYLGSVDAQNSPLPVQLTSFSGKPNGTEVDLEWGTQSELNNYSFTVLRSTDGKSFASIGVVDGNGTSNKAHQYYLQDSYPEKGNNYYRLEQTDFNGRRETLKTIVVEMKEGSSTFGIYPNPVYEGSLVNVNINGLPPRVEQEIQVMDLQGKVHSSEKIIPDENGNFRGQLNTNFSRGLYILRINSASKKLLVKQ